MPKAEWNGVVIAEASADQVQRVEGNIYFPPTAIHKQFFHSSSHTSVCGWKGTANYYTVEVDGKRNENAAWYYATPKDAAKNIAGHIAFWKGVKVSE